MPRPDLSTIDQTLRSLGPLPNDLSRLLEGQLGSARLDARRADELLAALEALPHGKPQNDQRAPAAEADDEDEDVVIEIDPDDD